MQLLIKSCSLLGSILLPSENICSREIWIYDKEEYFCVKSLSRVSDPGGVKKHQIPDSDPYSEPLVYIYMHSKLQ
jgi:hypothetical protein